MKNLPQVTVIMPIRNEEDFITQSLNSILNQDYPSDKYEIIISDGMSDDRTREIIENITKSTIIKVKLIDNFREIVPTGFNEALKHAIGEIIIRIDGHCEVEPNYISQCVKYLESDVADGVGGPIITVNKGFVGKAIAVAMSSRFGVGNSAFRTELNKKMYVDTIPFPAYKREIIDQVGFLDEEMVRNQDDEYNYRLCALGYRLLLTPEIRSVYHSRNSLRKLWDQYYKYGLYKVRVMQKHPRQMRSRQFVPPLFILLLLINLALVPFNAIIGITLLLIYIITDIIISVTLSSRSTWRYILILPLVFPILHFSYGIGFLVGIIKFRARWEI